MDSQKSNKWYRRIDKCWRPVKPLTFDFLRTLKPVLSRQKCLEWLDYSGLQEGRQERQAERQAEQTDGRAEKKTDRPSLLKRTLRQTNRSMFLLPNCTCKKLWSACLHSSSQHTHTHTSHRQTERLLNYYQSKSFNLFLQEIMTGMSAFEQLTYIHTHVHTDMDKL
jgi:hypothetical protein